MRRRALRIAGPRGEPRVGKFVKYDTGDYVIVTSRSSMQAKRFMEDLVKFRLTLEGVLGKRATPNAFPTTIVITSASDWNKWLIPRQNVAGFFQGARFANYMAINGDAPLSEALHVMFHEYTHYYLGSQFAGEYPPWFNEGMAELMGYAKFDKGMAILQIPMHRVYEAREGNWIPFDRLIRVDHTDPEYQSHRLAPSFYAQSWLAVQYGMVEDREFGKQIFAYLHQLNTVTAQDEAARKGFGNDLAVPDKQLREYSRATECLRAPSISARFRPWSSRRASRSASSTPWPLSSDLMLESRLAPDRIRPLVESLERRDPNKARAAILAARLAQSRRGQRSLRPRRGERGGRARAGRLGTAARTGQRAARQRRSKAAR